MTFSPLTGARWPLGSMPNGGPRSSSRQGVKVDMFIVHHAAGGDGALRGAYVQPGRELSSTYAITNDGTIAGVLTEDLRPFTSSTYKADGRAITAEVANSAVGDASGWPVSDAAFHALARLIADCATRYGFPLRRGTRQDPRGVIGHREVLPFFGAGVATACPGGIWPRMDELVELARTYQRNGTDRPATNPEEDEMSEARLTAIEKKLDQVLNRQSTHTKILRRLEPIARRILTRSGGRDKDESISRMLLTALGRK